MDLIDEPYTPEPWSSSSSPGRVVAETDHEVWMSVPMAFGNFRLIGMPRAKHGMEQDWNPWWGWCYRGELALMAALAVWDPNTQDEPLGWHKRAGEPRRAPQRDEFPEYNWPRCIHGSYLKAGPCAVDKYCAEMKEANR